MNAINYARAALAAGFGAGLLLAGVAGARADTMTVTAGDQVGTQFVAACDAGEALVGFDYYNDERLLGVSAVCKPVLPGALGKTHRLKLMFGPDDQHSFQEWASTRCQSDMVVRGLEVFLASTLRVERVRLYCHVPAGDSMTVLVKHTNSSASPHSTLSKTVSCPSGQYATGLIGTYKGSIRSVGLQCHDDAPVAEPGGNGPTGKGGHGPFGKGGGPFGKGGLGPFGKGGFDGGSVRLEIDIGPNGASIGPRGGQFGPKGGATVRVLREASTVYADKQGTEIDYLAAGDRVTVIACEDGGRGWCRISGPTPGLIWGGDLK